MDSHVKEYFRQGSRPGSFHTVIALHDAPDINWRDIHKKIPSLPKGWFELSHLEPKLRADMLRDFWLSQIPFCPHILEQIDKFFAKVDDIGIFLVQKTFDSPFHAELVYSLKNDSGFFRGQIPASDDQLVELQRSFSDTILPEDYMAFLRIHNGFSKADDTGIIPSTSMRATYESFQALFPESVPLLSTNGDQINPRSLIPFYESFGMPFFQCFWKEWYPESEMGNVYYSGITNTIYNVNCQDPNSESMAFFTFTNWLVFYLEPIS